MNWKTIVRKSVIVTILAFTISSVLMLLLNSRVNWAQQGSTAILFFIGSSVVFFIQERKNAETDNNNE